MEKRTTIGMTIDLSAEGAFAVGFNGTEHREIRLNLEETMLVYEIMDLLTERDAGADDATYEEIASIIEG